MILLLCCAGRLRAQAPFFTVYDTKNGLNDNHITGICQDSRGFYWISSQGGINRFDGRFFKSFYPSELAGNAGLTENTHLFFESVPNRMLLVVDNGHLFELDCVFPRLEPVPGFENRVVGDVCRIDANTLLFGCADTVFVTDNRFRVLKQIVSPLPTKNNQLKLRVLEGRDRYLLSVGWWHHFMGNAKTGQTDEFFFDVDTRGLPASGVNLLHVDTAGKRLYVTNFFLGLFEVDFRGRISYHWPSVEVTGSASRIVADPQNDSLLWVAGDNGLTCLNRRSRKVCKFSLSAEGADIPVSNLYFDRGGKLWLSTPQGVFARSDFSSVRSQKLTLTEQHPPMNLIKSREGDLYLSQYYGGVFRIDDRTGKAEAFDPAEMEESWFIFEDGDRLLQGGKGTLLTCHDKRTGAVTKSALLSGCFAGSELLVLGFRQSNGDLWFSGNAGGGLARLHKGRLTRYSRQQGHFSHSYLTHYVEDMNGDLWFSCNKLPVLLHWLSKEERFEEIDFATPMVRYGLFQSAIQSLAQGPDGSLWIGFDGSGLIRYRPSDGRFGLYTKRNGLPANFVYSLVFDGKGRLWAGTKNGLACLEPGKNEIRVFNRDNGFPAHVFDNSCTLFDSATGLLWQGANDRLLVFDPDRVLAHTSASPAVFVDGISANNRPLDIRDTLEQQLASGENNIRIGFATLNPGNTGDVSYAYSLSGAAGPWISLGTSREVNFPNLSHGKYRFLLRAKTSGSDTWFYQARPLRFTIATPWYKTAWFAALLFLAFLGLIFGITRAYYVAKVRKQKNRLEKQLAIQAERDRISFDMHDDLGSGLTRISYLSRMAMGKSGHSPELEKIKNTSQELVGNMSELIWAMKADNDSLPELLGYLRGYASDYFDGNDIRLRFRMPDAIPDRAILGEKRRNIFLVYKEALHNIVKHAGAKNVEIVFEVDNDLRMEISDDGAGFVSEPEAGKGNGLRSMEMRTRRLDGHLEIRTGKGEGTHLLFRFPLDGLS